MAERFAAILVAGVFAGDPRQLSMQAAFPQLTDLVQEHGSLGNHEQRENLPGSEQVRLGNRAQIESEQVCAEPGDGDH